MKNFKILLFFCFSYLGAQQESNSQNFRSVYSINKNLELNLLSLSTALNISAILLAQNVKPLTVQEINLLSKNDIWQFERELTENWDNKSKIASDVLLYASLCNPILFYVQRNTRNDIGPISLIWLETLTINAGITNLTKSLISRKRPYLYGNKANMNDKKKKDNQRSFFSGHTSAAAASWFMFAKIYQDYNPQDKRIPYIWSISAVVPAITAYLRIKAGKHFYTDVIAGYLIGAAVGLTVPELHKKEKYVSTEIAMFPNGQLGLGVQFSF